MFDIVFYWRDGGSRRGKLSSIQLAFKEILIGVLVGREQILFYINL